MSNREIERKFELIDLSYLDVPGRLADIIGERALSKVLTCTTMDYYWVLGSAQFVRLRDSQGVTQDGFSRQLVEITAKKKDKNNNFDRAEINVPVGSAQQAFALLEMMTGHGPIALPKQEWVFWTHDGAILSASLVNGKVWIEVEAATEALVADYVNKLMPHLRMRPEHASFFELYIEKEIQ